MRLTREETNELEALSKLDGNGMKDKKIRELANKCKTLKIAFDKKKTMYASFHLVDVGIGATTCSIG
jgi:hypothetical protein